ncbi:MAG: hypothetical protein QOC65_700 [Sphingomonadales bacterium]|jgi:hypothetical protein|nr:hypothetical protein [Sphingomonadales bacterium]
MDYSATKLSHSDPLTDVRAARLLEALDAERTRAVSPGGAWQAMGTAPRDGTPILVWVRWQNAPAGPAIAQWDVVGRGWKRLGVARPIAPTIATHWMPLPAGPAA